MEVTYRIKSMSEDHQRVAEETELTEAFGLAQEVLLICRWRRLKQEGTPKSGVRNMGNY
jgi:hypothetical protein